MVTLDLHMEALVLDTADSVKAKAVVEGMEDRAMDTVDTASDTDTSTAVGFSDENFVCICKLF